MTHVDEKICPICATPLLPDDICATDIEMGICHAACLEGSPVVDLETGAPTAGPIDTYRYGDLDGVPAMTEDASVIVARAAFKAFRKAAQKAGKWPTSVRTAFFAGHIAAAEAADTPTPPDLTSRIESGAVAIWELQHKRMGGTISWAEMKSAIDADPEGYQATTWAFEDNQAEAKACLEAAYPTPSDRSGGDLVEYFERQITWSRETFGPALRTKGVIDHIRKELAEIEQKPHDLSEWIDVVILAMDGFWRHGGKASDLLPSLLAKQQKNMARDWPDWRGMSEDSAIEHDRSKDAASDDDAECCVACDVPFEEGDLVYWCSDDTGHLHEDCCGPEREAYVNADGSPLEDGEPIPKPFAWRAGR